MKKISLLCVLFFTIHSSFGQSVAVKSNLLFGAVATAPNLGVEIAVGKRSTIDLWGAYNSWGLYYSSEQEKGKIFNLQIVQPEYRYWLCEKFNGHFFGINGMYTKYDIGGVGLPLLFDKEFRYDGTGYGGGLSYGYHWMWSKRWGMEFTIGAGVLMMEYDKFSMSGTGARIDRFKKTYIGPTKVGLSIVFVM